MLHLRTTATFHFDSSLLTNTENHHFLTCSGLFYIIFVLLTCWLLAYGIFVLRFRPKKQQFLVALPGPLCLALGANC